jgi:hypothetical protein
MGWSGRASLRNESKLGPEGEDGVEPVRKVHTFSAEEAARAKALRKVY